MDLQIRITWCTAAPRTFRRASSKRTARVCWSLLHPILQPQAITLGGTRSFSKHVVLTFGCLHLLLI